jgi:hypothetical protein
MGTDAIRPAVAGRAAMKAKRFGADLGGQWRATVEDNRIRNGVTSPRAPILTSPRPASGASGAILTTRCARARDDWAVRNQQRPMDSRAVESPLERRSTLTLDAAPAVGSNGRK